MSLQPQTTPVPNPDLADIKDSDQIRAIALEIEELIGDHRMITIARPHMLSIRSMLLDYADLIERVS